MSVSLALKMIKAGMSASKLYLNMVKKFIIKLN